MTKLTTHVLDIYSGKPGKGIKVELYYYTKPNVKKKINTVVLNNDGRTVKPLAEGDNLKEGKYEIVFFVGEYFKKTNILKVPFLDDIVVKFGISDTQEHYHVPLLVSPWSYSTYRGS